MSVYAVPKHGKRGTRWHVRHKVGGNGPVKVLEVHDSEDVARERVRQIKAAMESSGGVVPHVPRELRIATLGAVADRWIEGQRASKAVKANTIKGYRRDRNRLGRLADLPARAITEEDVQNWINDHLIGELDLAPSTIRITLIRLATFLDAAKVSPNPARGRKRPKVKRAQRRLPSWADLQKVRANLVGLAEAKPHTAAVFMPALFDVLLYGGLRIEEATSLTWRNVDRRRHRLVGFEGKYDRLRNVDVLPFQPDWLPVRPEGAADWDLVFPLTTHTAYVALVDASSGHGLPHVHPHLLRHWHGSYLVATMPEHRMPPATIAHRMGHTVAVLLSTYTHEIVPDDAPDASSER